MGPIARHAALWVLAGALATLTACGTAPPPSPPQPAAPPPVAVEEGIPVPQPTGAAADSGGPTPEALSVLATIPEPLSPGERVPPPAPGSVSRPAETPPTAAGARDTTVEGTPGPGGQIPVPEPTTALGQRPPARPARDSSATGPMKNPPAEIPTEPPRPVVAAPPSTPPQSPPAQPPPARPPGDCWRVQVVASSDRAAVERVRMAAESVLSVPMVVEEERSLFKARSRECLDPAAADELKRRAIATGFPGSFRFVDRSP